MEMGPKQRNVGLRRILLAKQLYEHGLGHSRETGDLGKMIAVHNFHNAIEVVLRAIVLEYEIRPERTLNLDFESLLNLIDQFPEFKSRGLRLPYRQEIRKLNSVRNLVQHHVHEPEESTMDEWRVFSKGFLVQTFQEYFKKDFDNVSQVDFVADLRLRQLLLRSAEYQSLGNWEGALCACKLAFQYASLSFADLSPHRVPPSFLPSLRSADLELNAEVRNILTKVYERIIDAERYAALLTSGVSAAEFARYERTPIVVLVSAGGNPSFQRFQSEIASEDVVWAHGFVLATIIRWQSVGLFPKVLDSCSTGCDSFLTEATT